MLAPRETHVESASAEVRHCGAFSQVPTKLYARHGLATTILHIHAGHNGGRAQLKVVELLARVVLCPAIIGTRNNVAGVSVPCAEDRIIARVAVHVQAR